MTTITVDRAVVEQALSLCESVQGLRTDDEDGSTVWCQELIDALRAALAQEQAEPQDDELSAALGWPGGISDPVRDRKTLLQQVTALRAALARPSPATLFDPRGSLGEPIV